MGRKRAALLLASFVVATTFVGFAPAGPASAGATNHTVVVTLSDSGRHYTLQKGNHLDVHLSGPSYAIWSEPASTNDAVLHRTRGSSGATAKARFVAVAKGEVQVSATPHLICSSVCAGPVLPVFEVTVRIVAGATSPTASRIITVTYPDNSHHYRVDKGDHLDVQLSGPSSSDIWTEPATSDKAVLRRTGGSSGTTATATFVAKAKGRAQVMAAGTNSCPPCGQPTFLVEVTVVR